MRKGASVTFLLFVMLTLVLAERLSYSTPLHLRFTAADSFPDFRSRIEEGLRILRAVELCEKTVILNTGGTIDMKGAQSRSAAGGVSDLVAEMAD